MMILMILYDSFIAIYIHSSSSVYDVYLCILFQIFSEHQMSKIKKSEEISVEREKEIQQVNVCNS